MSKQITACGASVTLLLLLVLLLPAAAAVTWRVVVGFSCPQGSEYGLRVASRMERHSDQYTLIISSANKWLDR
jgi:hypothetical protein